MSRTGLARSRLVAALALSLCSSCVTSYYSAGFQGSDGRIYLMGIDNIPGIGNAPFIRQCDTPRGGVMLCQVLDVRPGAAGTVWQAPPAPPPSVVRPATELPAAGPALCPQLVVDGAAPTHVRAVAANGCPAAGSVYRLTGPDADSDKAQIEDAGGRRTALPCRCLIPL